MVEKFLAQGTPFLSRKESSGGLATIDYLLSTGQEFAYIVDKFMAETRIKMGYSTREGSTISKEPNLFVGWLL